MRWMLYFAALTSCFPGPIEPVDDAGDEVLSDATMVDSSSTDASIMSEVADGAELDAADIASCGVGECHIDGICRPNGARNSSNPCEVCAGEDRWSPDDGAPCDDGNACTNGDACSSSVCVPGTSLAVDVGSVVLLASGPVVPSNLAYDRGNQYLVVGALSPGTAHFNASAGILTQDTSVGPFPTFLMSGFPGLAKASWAAVISGEVQEVSIPLAAIVPSSTSLDFAVLTQPSDAIAIDGPNSKTFSVPSNTLACLQFDQAGIVSKVETWTADQLLFPFVSVSRHGTVIGGTFKGSFLSSPGGPQVENDTWAEGDPGLSFVARIHTDAAQLSQVDRVDLLRGLGIISLAALPDDRGLVAFGQVASTQTYFTASGPEVLEPSTDFQLFEFSDAGILVRHFPVFLDAPDLVSFNWPRGRVLPQIQVRDDSSYLVVAPLRDAQEVGIGVSQVIVDSDEGGVVVVSMSKVGDVEWVRRIRWMTGEPIVPQLAGGDVVLSEARVRANGGVVLAGTFSGTIELDDKDVSPFSLTAKTADFDGWLAGYDRDGRLTFAFDAVSGPGRGYITSVAEGADGAILATGPFEGKTTFGFGGSAGEISDVLGDGAFVMRVNSTGALDCGAFDASDR